MCIAIHTWHYQVSRTTWPAVDASYIQSHHSYMHLFFFFSMAGFHHILAAMSSEGTDY